MFCPVIVRECHDKKPLLDHENDKDGFLFASQAARLKAWMHGPKARNKDLHKMGESLVARRFQKYPSFCWDGMYWCKSKNI